MPSRASDLQPAAPRPFLDRWIGKIALLLLSVVMLTLALAPAKQFYLAWGGLVPWLLVVSRAKTTFRAFWWSWLAGAAFFVANMWWLAYVTAPGMVALLIYLGLYWGFAALIVRRLLGTEDSGPRTEAKTSQRPSSVPSPQSSMLLFATVWTSLEFIRGNLFTGLPWLYLGHTQSPILAACQIADTVGVFGISFGVAALNALVFFFIRGQRRRLVPAAAIAACLWIASCAYGFWRLAQTEKVTTPGPTVLVVQPNYPQDNSGEKGAPPSQIVRFHLQATAAAVESAARSGRPVDLACWSETMMPALNPDYHRSLAGAISRDRQGNISDSDVGATLAETAASIRKLAESAHVNILAGSLYISELVDPEHFVFADRRNSAYLIRSDGSMAAERYDKIHLVPFGEFIPFKRSRWFHWLYTFFNGFSPYDYDYTLTAGPEDRSTVFSITAASTGKPVRFVAPICFEDIDSRLCARMFRGDGGSKRADLIVNLTNDGWFKANENPQHLQAALFRSIENRAPTARSVNTGVSALIDSAGRVLRQVPQGTEGTAAGVLNLDPRYTIYSRYGDWFAGLCTLVTAALIVGTVIRWRRTRRRRET